MRTKYVLSRFAHFFPQEKAVGLFHSLDVRLIFISQELVDLLSSIGAAGKEPENLGIETETFNFLRRMKFLVSVMQDELQRMRTIKDKLCNGVYLHTAYLILSEQCNLACRYCFFECEVGRKLDETIMTADTVRNGLDCFARWAAPKQPACVILYGGDPLQAIPTCKFAIEYTEELIEAKKLNRHSTVSIVCNGTLIDKDFARFIVRHKKIANISVSLDGPRDLHDKWRVDFTGAGSYDRSMDGYSCLRDEGLQPGISCTLSPDGVERINEVTKWLLAQKPGGVSFNMLVDTPELATGLDYAENAAAAIIEAFKFFREHGLYEDRMMRKVASFTRRKRFIKDCAGYGEQIVVAPNGDLGICHAHTNDRKYFVANVNRVGTFDPRTDSQFLEWDQRTPLNMPECFNCPALGTCGGGCAYNAELRHGSIWDIDDRFCPHALATLEWMIGDVYRAMAE